MRIDWQIRLSWLYLIYPDLTIYIARLYEANRNEFTLTASNLMSLLSSACTCGSFWPSRHSFNWWSAMNHWLVNKLAKYLSTMSIPIAFTADGNAADTSISVMLGTGVFCGNDVITVTLWPRAANAFITLSYTTQWLRPLIGNTPRMFAQLAEDSAPMATRSSPTNFIWKKNDNNNQQYNNNNNNKNNKNGFNNWKKIRE